MKKKLQACFPLMLKKQKASLNTVDTLSYFRGGVEINIVKNEVIKITFTKVIFYLFGIVPLRVWDVLIIDSNNQKHILKNLKKDSKDNIISMFKNDSIHIEELPTETGIILLELVRDHSGRMPKWISVMVTVAVFLLLAITIYTFWLGN